MAYLIRATIKSYNYAMTELIDQRTSDWFLMPSILPILAIQLVYLYLVKKVGPKFMANRKPYNIDKILIVYNFLQVLACTYITMKIGRVVFTRFHLGCNPIDYSDDPDAVSLASAQWLYFITKIIDLLDTFFFILKKKERQITFLHVYHHCTMIMFGWGLARFIGGGQVMFVAFLNSFVHVWMYGYYLLTAWNKEYKQSVWWKRHLTELQLVQFFMGFCIQMHALFDPICGYPKVTLLISLPQNFFFFALFGDFYVKNYLMKKKKSAT